MPSRVTETNAGFANSRHGKARIAATQSLGGDCNSMERLVEASREKSITETTFGSPI